MALSLNRKLATLVILFGSISLANAQSVTQQSTSNPGTAGWAFGQDSPLIFCNQQTGNNCSVSPGQMVPTTAGSVWIIEGQLPVGSTITNVTGGGGTWVHCPNCQAHSAALWTDAWYNLTGNAGTFQAITVTFSGSIRPNLNFVEILPPPGQTASFDTSGSATPTNCSGTSSTPCTGVTLAGGGTLGGTDAVWTNPGGASGSGWNDCSAPYITTANDGCLALNTNSGAALTKSYTPCNNSTCNPAFMAIAFKSTAGFFSVTAPQYSIVNYVAPATVRGNTTMNCTPNCNLAIPATGTGHLLYLESNSPGTLISSVSGGGSWVVPAACKGNAVIMGQSFGQSCAYVLSSTAGATNLTITMAGNSASTAFGFFEIASNTGGTFVFDGGGSHNDNGGSTTFYPLGQAFSGLTNDVIIQAITCNGGSLGPNYYAQPSNQQSFNYFNFNLASVAILTDSGPNPPTPVWANPQHNLTIDSGMAFSAQGGVSTSPNPPTGLNVVVQ